MSVENDSFGKKADKANAFTISAHGSFWNLNNRSLQKKPQNSNCEEKNNRSEQTPERPFEVTDGTDFVGENYKMVTYRIDYWDSFLAVFSLGLYVPLSIEYIPVKMK